MCVCVCVNSKAITVYPLEMVHIYCVLGVVHTHTHTHTDLHDEKVRVVDIELDGAEKVLHSRWSGITAIDEILVSPSYHHLCV